MNLSSSQILAIGAVGIAGYLVYRGSGTVAAAAQAVNPTNPDNIINRGFNAIVETATGKEDFSLGSAIYDLFHPTYDPNEPIRGPSQ